MALGLAAALVIGFLFPTVDFGVPTWLRLPLSDWAEKTMQFLASGLHVGGLTLQQLTRIVAAGFDAPIKALVAVFVDGVAKGSGFNKVQIVPPVSWLAVAIVVVFACHRLGSLRLAVLGVVVTGYIVLFGFYAPAMLTLINVLGSIVFAVVAGLGLGIWAYSNDRVYSAVRAVMNIMQTVPIFSYLLPTLLFFGYGPSAALLATVIYAMPPMVHATVLAFRAIPPEIVEYARMAGCTPRQVLWRVELPTALPKLAIGVNQAVMMSFNMVIITSMIGVGGLGYLVLQSLRKLDIGSGMQAGMAIVLLGVLLDRMTMAYSDRVGRAKDRLGARQYGPLAAIVVALTALSIALPVLQKWPSAWTITSAPFWNGLVSWINVHLFDWLEAIRTFLLLDILNPYRNAVAVLPFVPVLVVVTLAGLSLGGTRTALFVGVLTAFIGSAGFWEPALNSFYLVSVSVAAALLAGVPIGLFFARREAWRAPVAFFLDTLQTLPTLVYLLPAVMLFRNGDVSAIFAISAYAVATVIRYVIEGIRNVPVERREAGLMNGCSPLQLFVHIDLPSALPSLLLGLNQTIMMALSMLIIAAMVGTKDLGQEVFMSLTRAQTGTGIVVGLCVAALGLIADALLKSAAERVSRASKEH